MARWYDSYLNHFTQPDTIITDPYNPASWNRYAYVHYNPIKYTDPTGHMVDEEGSYNPWKKTVRTEDGIVELPLFSVTELVDKQSFVEPVVTTIPVDQSLYPGSWSFPNNDKPPIDISEFTLIESGPLLWSVFIETGLGVGEGCTVGVEYYTDFKHDYLGLYLSRSEGIDVGANVSIGTSISNDDFFSYTNGDDNADVFFGGNLILETSETKGVGLTIGVSPDMSGASVALSLGLRYAFGFQFTERPFYLRLD